MESLFFWFWSIKCKVWFWPKLVMPGTYTLDQPPNKRDSANSVKKMSNTWNEEAIWDTNRYYIYIIYKFSLLVLSRLAKIRPSGIHFKASNSPLVYLVDEAGVRTNFSENFMRMDRDITLDVLYKDCRHGAMYLNVCNDLLSDIKSSSSETGREWKLYDLLIVQENKHGFVR